MIPQKHQVEGAAWALNTIRTYGLAYMAWEERTRKTLTALLCVEGSKASSCLVITKKKALPGWKETLQKWPHKTKFTVVNYESIHSRKKVKGKQVYTIKPEYRGYEFLILDEAHHAISGIGRPSTTWKSVKGLSKGLPILYLSATPYAEHVGLLYHQLKLSDWCPFKETNFYEWYRRYGIPNMTRTPYGLQDKRDRYKTDKVLKKVSHLFNFKTRQQVGIKHEPEANLVLITPKALTVDLMKEWRDKRLITINNAEIIGDSDSKVRSVHYQLEGGTLKIDDSVSVYTGSTEKLVYIKENYKGKTIAIMAHFVKERELLTKHFPDAEILSSDGDAEGVDLSMYDKLIIYSLSFRTSKHTQRMARQANHDRKDPIEVDVLVMDKPGVGKAVYDSVAVKKENFVKTSYQRAWQ